MWYNDWGCGQKEKENYNAVGPSKGCKNTFKIHSRYKEECCRYFKSDERRILIFSSKGSLTREEDCGCKESHNKEGSFSSSESSSSCNKSYINIWCTENRGVNQSVYTIRFSEESKIGC